MRIFEQGDLFDLDTKSELIFIQDLKKGDLVETSIGTDVVEFVKVTDLHGNATQTCSIFGATLLPNHPFVYNGIWTSLIGCGQGSEKDKRYRCCRVEKRKSFHGGWSHVHDIQFLRFPSATRTMLVSKGRISNFFETVWKSSTES